VFIVDRNRVACLGALCLAVSRSRQVAASSIVDIYAAVDDDVRDNRHLAALNGVRFNSFLATLVRTLPAQVTDVDACYHAPGLVTATGFALPNT
jgi:hypothetical protein